MKLLTLLYVFCLFYVFIPGNVFKLPIKTSKMNVILIHAFLFSVVLSYTYGLVENVRVLEGMNSSDRAAGNTTGGSHTHMESDIIKENEGDNKKPSMPSEIQEKRKNIQLPNNFLQNIQAVRQQQQPQQPHPQNPPP